MFIRPLDIELQNTKSVVQIIVLCFSGFTYSVSNVSHLLQYNMISSDKFVEITVLLAAFWFWVRDSF